MQNKSQTARNQQDAADSKPPQAVETRPEEADDIQGLEVDSAGVNEENSKHSIPSPEEVGGPQGLEPTRYGDWEKRGRCIDF
ncbi:MAG: DUF1674 domain-containing protein [Gammaproteobacteria bacterium]|nr:MAG: DUF1674 domain-containing protein [Gammaproteobacteria bacterium]